MVHSGRHATYGSPKYPAMQVHAAALLLSLHLALAPQGEGLQGSLRSVDILGGTKNYDKARW